MKNINAYDNGVYIRESACVTGKLEKEGPLGDLIDFNDTDGYFGKPTWEQAETEMVRTAVNILLEKSKIEKESISFMTGGDLLNQCTATGFAAAEFGIRYLGLYGACSTFAESLIIGGEFINSCHADKVIAVGSSHFCTSERQYRTPLCYGAVRTPTAQNTVTGAGALLLCKDKTDIRISASLIGKVRDDKITDAGNMGAAMAGAAFETVCDYFNETGASAEDYDVIATGDLGREGGILFNELLIKSGFDIANRHKDCGNIIYDTERQKVFSGGSGVGCSASVTAAYFFDKLKRKEIGRMLLVGTGAMLSAKTALQGLSIPAVAHLVVLESV